MQPSSPIFVLSEIEGTEIRFSRKFALLEPISDGNFILLETFAMSWEEEDAVYRLRIPAGFITDIASVPRWAWTLSGLTPDGLHRNAALVHDILYMWYTHRYNYGLLPATGWFQVRRGGEWVNVPESHAAYTKTSADKLFLRIMKANGVSNWNSQRMYWAVKLGGLPAWLSDNSKEQDLYRDPQW